MKGSICVFVCIRVYIYIPIIYIYMYMCIDVYMYTRTCHIEGCARILWGYVVYRIGVYEVSLEVYRDVEGVSGGIRNMICRGSSRNR